MGNPVRLNFHLAKSRTGPKVLNKYQAAAKRAKKELGEDGKRKRR
jgi:hypothetical protein